LNLEKTILDDHQARIVLEVDAGRVQTARQRAARKLASRGKIPGFRPGKAPYEVILRYYGDAAVYEQAVDLLVDDVYPEMLKAAEIQPAAAGVLETVDGTDHPKFTFRVPLAPEVQLGDYRAIRAPYEFEPPGPEKLEQALYELRQAYGTTETVDREIAFGDYVVVDIVSSVKSLERTGFAIIVRDAGREDEFPFQGFGELLIGLKLGATKDVEHAFSESASDATLAGQTVEMQVTIKAVRSMTVPPLDDEFAKMVGQYDSLASLKEALVKEIEGRARAEYEDQYFSALVDKIRLDAVVKYAPQTLDHEAEHVVDDMRRRLAQQGLDLDTYYKMRSTDAAKFLENEAKPVARKRLERALILDEVSRQEKIEVDNNSLDEEFNNTLVDLQTQGVSLSAVRGGKQGQQRVAEALAMQSANRLLTRRTLERLRKIASGEYTPQEAEAEMPKRGSVPQSPKQKGVGAGRAAGKTGAPKTSRKSATAGREEPKARKSTSKK
jgi:trigger factor